MECLVHVQFMILLFSWQTQKFKDKSLLDKVARLIDKPGIRYSTCHPKIYLMKNMKLYHLDLIPRHLQKTDTNLVYTDFESFYQVLYTNLLIYQILKNHISKKKSRSARKKYNTIEVSYKDRRVINSLSKKLHKILLHRDKGRGIVIMDEGKYTEKCMNILNAKQFCKLRKDPTKIIKLKIQWVLRKIKNKLSPQEYLNIY